MPLESPNLDDRNYEQLVKEIRSLIPTYAPEWTDWNEHDPGISLIQLFSHLTEMLMYRLNQVPEKNYIEFLRLIGIERKPAVPAQVHVTFTLSDPLSDPNEEIIIIRKGTPVSAEGPEDGERIVFETDEALKAVTTKLTRIQCFDGKDYHPQKVAEDEGSQPFHPFGNSDGANNALYLGFDRQLPQEEVSMRIELNTSNMPTEGAHCELEESTIHSPVELAWEFWNGNGWQPLDIIRDDTKDFLRSGYIYFRGPDGAANSSEGVLTEEKLYWIRCLVVQPGYEWPPFVDKILLNTVPATNAVTVEDEIIGSSNSSPNQKFYLKNTPVISDKVTLEVNEGDGWVEWAEVDEFTGSLRDSRHYTLNAITGEIKFGDMIHGKIPFAGDKNIRASYKYGGGKSGNVAPGTITTMETSPRDIEKVTNYMAAEGGEDEESLKLAKKKAPLEIKTRYRAVTSEDFEYLAKETPGMRVARAKALPLFLPGYAPEIKIPGVVTVVIVPASEGNKPIPSKGMIRTVCQHLNKHRLATTELYVIPPKYKKVVVRASIVAHGWADLKKLRDTVVQKLNEYYHPLKGGPKNNAHGEGWPFGGDIHFSEAYRVILDIPEIKNIPNLSIKVDNGEFISCENIPISEHYLVYSDGHEIEVMYDRESDDR